ncbi:testis-specific serine kinase substrate-like [Ahaetulla prasina]|uniref:testis-specific serine kinase substrate-like n=1 Tax=Ahaetulla prasina TaxID=499056 RepID=UPI00264A0192|nr:testis-specific serine kinase substrate-like [Ahaetulla prasina]
MAAALATMKHSKGAVGEGAEESRPEEKHPFSFLSVLKHNVVLTHNPVMANMVKTIWQFKEINEAGDTPTGIESQAQGSKEEFGKSTSIPQKKKTIPFHGVEPHITSESPNLNLKRSSACTNVSLLNLTDGERDDSTSENESTDDEGLPWGAGDERRDPLLPIKTAWSEDEDNTSSQQESCQKVTKSVEDAEIKTSMLEENSALFEEKLRNLQQQVQVEDFRWKCMLELAQKEVLQLLAQLGVHLEGVLPQNERTQVEQGQALRMLREELDEVSATAKRASISLTQLRVDLDGLWQVNPLLEDVSQYLGTLKNTETLNWSPPTCARCSSYSIANTEVLQKMFEHATAPILEELKQRAQSEVVCPSCQHL